MHPFSDDEVIFLDLDVKLSKYAPPKWKEVCDYVFNSALSDSSFE